MALSFPLFQSVPLRLFAIDPGTNFLGLSVFYLDPSTFEILEIIPQTIVVEHVEQDDTDPSQTYGARFIKMLKIKQAYETYLTRYQPGIVVCEAPFYNRLRPSAFAPLIETLQTLKLSTYNLLPQTEFLLVEPTVVKKGIGAHYIADKETVRQVVLARTDLQSLSKRDFATLDEHSIDSLAIGYTYLTWFNNATSFNKGFLPCSHS
jgi:Holliday junction resolvasome RuvABC endonuclease subunit